MKSWTVYRHINKLNGKSYVGITQQKLLKRFKAGYGYPERDQPLFAKAIKKYGWANFITEILESDIKTLDLANEREQYWIAYYHTYIYDPECNGYNALPGGNIRLGHLQTAETRKKISKELTGIKRSKLTKLKIQKAKLGKKLSEKHKEALRKAQKLALRKAVQCVETGEIFESVSAAVQKYGDSIRKCLYGKTEKAYGFHWKFIKNDSNEVV